MASVWLVAFITVAALFCVVLWGLCATLIVSGAVDEMHPPEELKRTGRIGLPIVFVLTVALLILLRWEMGY